MPPESSLPLTIFGLALLLLGAGVVNTMRDLADGKRRGVTLIQLLGGIAGSLIAALWSGSIP